MRLRDAAPRPSRLPHRSTMEIGAALVLALALAACGSSGSSSAPIVAAATPSPSPVPTPAALTAVPAGFPTTFADERPTTLPRLSVVDDGLQGHLEGSLVADGGLTAAYSATWIEHRVPVATIACGGLTYTGVFTVEDPTLTSEVTFPGWGSGTLVATKRVVVYVSSRDGSSPPVCEELGGGSFTIDFDAGSPPGILSGSWSETADGVVILAPIGPTSVASPSS